MTPDGAEPASAGPARDLAGYEVIVALTGGIAAYKVCTVISRLAQAGAGVTAVMTRSARKFIGQVTLQGLTGRQVYQSLWEAEKEYDPQHISLTEAADLFVVAPATGNILGKVASGIADDLVTTMIMAADSPVIFAPRHEQPDVVQPHRAGQCGQTEAVRLRFHRAGRRVAGLPDRRPGPDG